jgi:hypothetical protein
VVKNKSGGLIHNKRTWRYSGYEDSFILESKEKKLKQTQVSKVAAIEYMRGGVF